MESEVNFTLEMEDFEFETDTSASSDVLSSNIRFQHVNEEQKVAFKLEQKNKNTNTKTRSDVKLFKKYLSCKKYSRKHEDIPGPDLNVLLEEFFMCLRKSDNSE